MLGDQKELLSELLPFWNNINHKSKEQLLYQAEEVHFKKGAHLHAGKEKCSGLFLLKSGRIRAYIVTEEGKEVTLFRLLDRDVCIFSAACMMKNISFEIYISAETDVDAIRIPTKVYDELSKEEVSMAHFTSEILGSRMSEVMWVLEKILFMSFDKRLAYFLLEESQLEQSNTLTITQEQVASHLGSAREVISRMLKYFSKEGLVKVERGRIILVKEEGLRKLAGY